MQDPNIIDRILLLLRDQFIERGASVEAMARIIRLAVHLFQYNNRTARLFALLILTPYFTFLTFCPNCDLIGDNDTSILTQLAHDARQKVPTP
jgi:hypothetical protein